MISPHRRRGEPLAALVLIVLGWSGARAMLWELPQVMREPLLIPKLAAAPLAPAISIPETGLHSERHEAFAAPLVRHGSRNIPVSGLRTGNRPLEYAAPSLFPAKQPAAPVITVQPVAAPQAAPLLVRDTRPTAFTPTVAQPARVRTDAWIAWRAGGGLSAIAAGARPASYGGSQAGAVMRYALARSIRDPAAYVRTTFAPDRPSQAELAAGIGLRPHPRVPVRAQAEVRATRTSGLVEVRPAVLAITELPPFPLPLGFSADAYAQGGWVGGRYATLFADGQARATRAVAQVGPARLRAGAGAWGGAQKFAERVDVGPTLEASVDAGSMPLRLSLDYRIKIAGNASPENGVAVTLATGF